VIHVIDEVMLYERVAQLGIPAKDATLSPTSSAPTSAPTSTPTSAPTSSPTSAAVAAILLTLAPTKTPTPRTAVPTGTPTIDEKCYMPNCDDNIYSDCFQCRELLSMEPTMEPTTTPSNPPVATLAPTTLAPTTCKSIYELVCSDSDFSILCGSLESTGLSGALKRGTWTLFAPTNDAFVQLPSLYVKTLAENLGVLARLLLFHAVEEQALYQSDLPCEARENLITMANGKNSRTLCVDTSPGRPVPVYQKGNFNEDDNLPEIVNFDMNACNGVVHELDGVMLFRSVLDLEGRQTNSSSAEITTVNPFEALLPSNSRTGKTASSSRLVKIQPVLVEENEKKNETPLLRHSKTASSILVEEEKENEAPSLRHSKTAASSRVVKIPVVDEGEKKRKKEGERERKKERDVFDLEARTDSSAEVATMKSFEALLPRKKHSRTASSSRLIKIPSLLVEEEKKNNETPLLRHSKTASSSRVVNIPPIILVDEEKNEGEKKREKEGERERKKERDEREKEP